MAAKFITDLDVKSWQAALANYEKVLLKKAEQKSKKESRHELIQLDKWYQETLPNQINSRSEKYLKSEELVDLVRWKLSRGKFRPRLVEYAKNNPQDEVENRSKLAFKKIDGSKNGKTSAVMAGLEELTKLKGIGPATASAILAAGCPSEAPFMADEPTQDVLQSPKLKYTKPEYQQYVEVVLSIRDKLRDKDPSFDWTAHKVELALWVRNVGTSLGVDLTPPTPATNGDEPQAESSKEPQAESSKEPRAESSKDSATMTKSTKSSHNKRKSDSKSEKPAAKKSNGESSRKKKKH